MIYTDYCKSVHIFIITMWNSHVHYQIHHNDNYMHITFDCNTVEFYTVQHCYLFDVFTLYEASFLMQNSNHDIGKEKEPFRPIKKWKLDGYITL